MLDLAGFSPLCGKKANLESSQKETETGRCPDTTLVFSAPARGPTLLQRDSGELALAPDAMSHGGLD